MEDEVVGEHSGPDKTEAVAESDRAQADDLEVEAGDGEEVTGGARGLAVGKGIRIRSN